MASLKLTDEELILIICREIRKSRSPTKEFLLQDIRNSCEKYGKDALPKNEILDLITSRLLHHLKPGPMGKKDLKPSNVKSIHHKYKNLLKENKRIAVVDKMNAPLKKGEFCASYNVVIKKSIPKMYSQKLTENKNSSNKNKFPTNNSTTLPSITMDSQKLTVNKNSSNKNKFPTNNSTTLPSITVCKTLEESKAVCKGIPNSGDIDGINNEQNKKANKKAVKRKSTSTKVKKTPIKKEEGAKPPANVQEKIILKGTVKNSRYMPIAGAKIVVMLKNSSKVLVEVTTSDTGEYELDLGMIGETCSIIVSKENFFEKTETVALKDRKIVKNFTLLPGRKGKSALYDTTKEDMIKMGFKEEDVNDAFKKAGNNSDLAFILLTTEGLTKCNSK